MRYIFFGRQQRLGYEFEPGQRLFIDGQQPGGAQAGGGLPAPPPAVQPQLPSPAELGMPGGGGAAPPPAPPAAPPAPPAAAPPPAPVVPRTHTLTDDDLQRLVANGIQHYLQRQQQAPPAAAAPPPPAANPAPAPAAPVQSAQQPAAPAAPPPPAAPQVDPAQEALRSRQLELERELKLLREEQQRTQREKELALQQAGEARVQQTVIGELVSADIGLSQIAANKAYAELKASGRIRPHTDNQVYVVLPDENGVERTHYLKDGLKKWMLTSDGLFYKGAVPAGAGSTPSSIGSMPQLAGGQNPPTPEFASSAAAAARNLEHDLRLIGQLPPGPRG